MNGLEGNMIYYIYYDSYGHPTRAISALELEAHFGNDTNAFLKDVQGPNPGTADRSAHVGTLRFHTERELKDFLDGMNEVNQGFFEGEGDSRPYNF